MNGETKNFYRDFGRRLAKVRKDVDVTQEALADAVGLSRTSITNIEKGRQPVQVHLLLKVAAVLGVEPSALLGDHNSVGILEDRKLDDLHPDKRRWVERVIGTESATKEADNGRQVQSFATESARPVTPSRSK